MTKQKEPDGSLGAWTPMFEGVDGVISEESWIAGEHVYFASEEGKVHVVQAGDKYHLVGVNELGESIMATPACSQGEIFIRSTESLWCIGTRRPMN